MTSYHCGSEARWHATLGAAGIGSNSESWRQQIKAIGPADNLKSIKEIKLAVSYGAGVFDLGGETSSLLDVDA